MKDLFLRIKKIIELSKYDDFTIADYLRKQGSQIGENNRIQIRNLGPEPYLIDIGNHCTIASNVFFLAHDGAAWVFTEEFPSLQKFGSITILDNCFIGSNSIILGNVVIGPNSVIGAGSVVTKNIPANVVAAGNPARIICPIEKYKEKVLKMWERQKPPGYMSDLKEGVRYTAQYIQQLKYRDINLLKTHLIREFSEEINNKKV